MNEPSFLKPSIDKEFLTSIVNDEDIKFSLKASNLQDINAEFFELFNKDASLIEAIFFRMMHEHITATIKTNESKQIFVKNQEVIFKKCPTFDNKMLDIFNEFVYDVQAILPYFDCNLIGGKLADYFDNKTVEESFGDYDIWLGPDVNYNDVMQCMIHLKNKYELLNETHRFIEYQLVGTQITFQIIKESFDTFETILNGFDFLHCSVGYDGQSFFWKKGALKSIKKKELFVNKIAPTRVLNERLSKYIMRGYKLSFPTFSLLSISCILGLMSVEIQEKLFFKYQAEYPSLFGELRGNSGGYGADANDNF